jgi:copper chaperone CopZ
MAEITFNIPGMYADHHVSTVVEALGKLPGINEITASAMRKKVTVAYDPTKVSPVELESTIVAAGYTVEKGEGTLREEDLSVRKTKAS